MNRKAQLIGIWCGPMLALMFVVGPHVSPVVYSSTRPNVSEPNRPPPRAGIAIQVGGAAYPNRGVPSWFQVSLVFDHRSDIGSMPVARMSNTGWPVTILEISWNWGPATLGME